MPPGKGIHSIQGHFTVKQYTRPRRLSGGAF